jgi:hypothetical protein
MICVIVHIFQVESHCISRHNTPGIKCEKTGCMVRAKNKGDIGRHKYYCHDLKAGKKIHCCLNHTVYGLLENRITIVFVILGWWKILVEWA